MNERNRRILSFWFGSLSFAAACSKGETTTSENVAAGVQIDTVLARCVDARGREYGDAIGSVAIDSSGALVVLDASRGHIIRYDEGGQCEARGGLGGGPNELLNPAGMAAISKNRIAVLDAGRQSVMIYDTDSSGASAIQLRGFPEPSSSDALWFGGGTLWATRFDRSGERYARYHESGDSVRSVWPELPLTGECAHPSARKRGVGTAYAATLDFAIRADGVLVGGCTQSDSLWAINPESPGQAQLLTVLGRERLELGRILQDSLIEQAFRRFRKDEPSLRRSEINVPSRVPSWRGIASLDAETLALLVVDSLSLNRSTTTEAADPLFRAWYSVRIVSLNESAGVNIPLPFVELANRRIVATRNTVVLRVSVGDGEDAMLRIRFR